MTCADVVKQYRRLDDQIITRLNRAQAQLRDHSRLSSPGPSSWSRAGGSSTGAATASLEGVEGMCVRMWGEMMGQSGSSTLLPTTSVLPHTTLMRPRTRLQPDGRTARRSSPFACRRCNLLSRRNVRRASRRPTSGLPLRRCLARQGGESSDGRRRRFLCVASLPLRTPELCRLRRGLGGPARERAQYRGDHSETHVRRCVRRASSCGITERGLTGGCTAFRSRCPFFEPPAGDAVGRGWWDLAESGRAGKGPDVP